MQRECGICKQPALQCCSNCNLIYYCSREHQKLDWKNGHKTKCAPYKTETNEILGRHLIATRHIKAGEIIMKKNPLVIGPKIASFPTCLGCHKKLETDERFYRCAKCNWPMCNEECENLGMHEEECEIYSKIQNVPKIQNVNTKQIGYCLVTPLRALLLKFKNNAQYRVIENMQSHLNENEQSPLYAMYKANLVPFVQKALGRDVFEKEILSVCSIFDTNAFEVRSSSGLVNVRALYPTAHLMAHDCKHNTKHTFSDNDFKIIVTATEDINKGQILTTSYTQTLWGTLTRKSHLIKVKKFNCLCDRCKDPTEFGTYAGSIYCTICKNSTTNFENNILPKMISTNPLDPNATWKCEKCDRNLSAKQIIWGNEAIKKEISEMDTRHPRNLEKFLIKYENLLHPTNYHFLEVKYALSQIYGNVDPFKLTGTF